ncbi:MAG: phosphoserine phosphatase [Chloroflexota bacterium]|nr:phosphoserine phosphatase [Chloroflexota bacterium]
MADPPRLTGVDGSIVLVRHGESTWVAENRFQGQSDPPLSALGEQQAALVAKRLADPMASPALPLPAGAPIGIWHSPLRRAAATAAAISGEQRIAVAVHADDRLKELAQGLWEGLTHPEVVSRYGAELEAWRLDPVASHAPGGESLDEGAARVRGALDGMLGALRDARPASDTGGDPVLGYGAPATAWPWSIVAAHDGTLRLLLLELLELPLARYWALPFALCGVTVVEITGGRARLRAHNLAEHLESLARPALAATDRGGAL